MCAFYFVVFFPSSVFLSLCLSISLTVCVTEGSCTRHSPYMQVRGQFMRVTSLPAVWVPRAALELSCLVAKCLYLLSHFPNSDFVFSHVMFPIYIHLCIYHLSIYLSSIYYISIHPSIISLSTHLSGICIYIRIHIFKYLSCVYVFVCTCMCVLSCM